MSRKECDKEQKRKAKVTYLQISQTSQSHLVERQVGHGSGCEGRWGGTRGSRSRGNYKQHMLCILKKSVFSECQKAHPILHALTFGPANEWSRKMQRLSYWEK